MAVIITQHPKSVSAIINQVATFSVTATGSGTLTYQWQYKSPGTTSWYNSSTTGATTASINITATSARNGQQYRCKVTDSANNPVFSNAATLHTHSAPAYDHYMISTMTLYSIADSIREKNGSTSTYTPEQMAEAILNL